MEPDPTRGKTRTRRLSLRKLAWLALAVLVLSPALLHGFHLWRHDLVPLFEGVARLRDSSRELVERARGFDQRSALDALGPNSKNGFSHRFDDHLDTCVAKASPAALPRGSEGSRLISIEFAGSETVTFASKQGSSSIADGVLRTEYAERDSLVSQGELRFDPDQVGEIQIRMKHSLGKSMLIGWSRDGVVQNELAVSLLPVHGEFYDYRIHAGSLFHETRDQHFDAQPDARAASAPVLQISLQPSDTPGDRVEIDYVRFVSKRSKYAEVAHGETYETIADEMRKVIYVNSPLALEFTLDLPAEKLWLETGLGVLDGGDPVRFVVTLRQGSTESALASEEVADDAAWRTVKRDVSEWAGQTVTIRFEATSRSGNVAFWSNPAIFGLPREPFNVVLLLEDALRADHLSCAGHPRPTTPAKDRLASEGSLFLEAFSQETKTRPSCPALMTSLYPTASGVWTFDEVLHDHYLTLAEILRSQGFETASFVQNPNAGPGAGLQQGFSYVFEKQKVGVRAQELYRAAESWIADRRDRNVFVYLHVIDPHAPYDPPPPYDAWGREVASEPGTPLSKPRREYFDPEWVEAPTRELRRALYAGEVAHNDARFAEFWSWLDANAVARDTLLIQVADHGEFLGEFQLWDHRTPGFVPVIHVPLLMTFPGRLPAGRRIEAPVQLIDVMPSILELAGIATEPLLIQGRSLVPLMRGEDEAQWNRRVVVSDEVLERKDKGDDRALASLIYRNLHLLNSHSFSFKRRLPHVAYLRTFDRREDPAENDFENSLYYDPIYKLRIGSLVSELQRTNVDIWFALTNGVSGTMDYDPETIARLKSLGYL